MSLRMFVKKDLAFERARAIRQMCEKMSEWIRVLSFMDDEDEDELIEKWWWMRLEFGVDEEEQGVVVVAIFDCFHVVRYGY